MPDVPGIVAASVTVTPGRLRTSTILLGPADRRRLHRCIPLLADGAGLTTAGVTIDSCFANPRRFCNNMHRLQSYETMCEMGFLWAQGSRCHAARLVWGSDGPVISLLDDWRRELADERLAFAREVTARVSQRTSLRLRQQWHELAEGQVSNEEIMCVRAQQWTLQIAH